MQRQHHETLLDRPMAEIFSALVGVVGHGRWGGGLLGAGGDVLPAGTRYEQQRGSVLRRGRVVECIRPVSITLQETLLDPPCRVELKLRWRLEPGEAGSRLRLEASYKLGGAATFRKEHWDRCIRAHCSRMLAKLEASLAEDAQDESLVSGQKIGSTSIAVTNVTSVSGKPTLKKSLNR
ncbi:MAG: hypothetical protein LOD94_00705 [Gammaproteobacteria bacterium]